MFNRLKRFERIVTRYDKIILSPPLDRESLTGIIAHFES
jgi:hypothetical protein